MTSMFPKNNAIKHFGSPDVLNTKSTGHTLYKSRTQLASTLTSLLQNIFYSRL
jgi:hypothetical protein